MGTAGPCRYPSLLIGEQGAATFFCPAIARCLLLDFFSPGNVSVGFEMIIVKEFLARSDIAQGVDENAPLRFADFAIGIAGMVDPLGFIPANRRIDHPFTVADCEKIHSKIIEFCGNTRPSNAPASVFNNALAFPKRFRREHATAMDT